VKDLSEKILNKEIHFKNLNKMTEEQIISEYTKVKGIGVWTVHMFLIFTLARLNVLPVGDLGLKRAVMIIYNLRKLPDEKKMFLISKKNNWAPYNSIASWYLWRSLEIKTKPKD
jgi:DNA-3-methyladenine glycosylase II